MKAPLNPQEKKRFSYERDHLIRGGENDKAFRRKHPLKKARAKRADWRRVVQAVRGFPSEARADGGADAFDLRPVRRQRLEKWGVTPLGQHVQTILANRAAGSKRERRAAREAHLLTADLFAGKNSV
jgi:hypothetical protein